MKEKFKQWGWRAGFAVLMALAKDTQVINAQEALKGGLRLPFSGRWALTGGPHGTSNNRIWNGLDFAPFDESTPCPGGKFERDWAATASGDGTVKDVNQREGYVKVDHGELESGYLHLTRIVVNENDQIKGGEVIGYIGCIGRTTGGHLHWFVERGGNPVSINGMRVGDYKIESSGEEYQGALVGEEGVKRANTARCGADTYKNKFYWVNACDEVRNDLTENYWQLPITGPGGEGEVKPIPKPVPTPARPTATATPRPVVIPDIKIITNTPTPRPTNTPLPPPKPQSEILLPKLACVHEELIPGQLNNVPDNLDHRAINVVVQSYNELLCLTQGDRDSDEGMLVIGDFEQNPPDVKGLKWLDTHQVRWFRERRDGDAYRLVNGQAVIEANFAVEHSRLRLDSTPPLLRYEVKLNPRYRYRYEVIRRKETQDYPNLPTGQFSGLISDEFYPFLLDLGENLRWSARFNPTVGHNPIKYPLKIMLTR